MTTSFVILASLRALFLLSILSYLLRRVLGDRSKRLAFASVIVLFVAAALDANTPDGVDAERVFGHPFVFYVFANAPIVLAALVILLMAFVPMRNREDKD